MMKKLVLLMATLMLATTSFSQSDNKEAHEKTVEAIELMDNGQIKEAIVLLDKALKLDPGNANIIYEQALAYYLDQNYKKSISILTKLKKNKDAGPLVYQLLGNSYSMDKQRPKAIKTYEEGLEKYPDAGQLYLERGNVELMANNLTPALFYYEEGIKADPKFPSNYYWAAKIFSLSSEEVWGMIYGEIFMNLERGSQRTVEISKLLFDTYKSEIGIKNDTISVSFCQNKAINPIREAAKPSYPYGLMIYELTLLNSIVGEKEINMESLNRIRTRFVELYYEKEFDQKYPNALFDYQNKIKEAGHMEAYNYWLLMQGDVKEFQEWRTDNEEKWLKFMHWFEYNPIQITDQNRFYREQY